MGIVISSFVAGFIIGALVMWNLLTPDKADGMQDRVWYDDAPSDKK